MDQQSQELAALADYGVMSCVRDKDELFLWRGNAVNIFPRQLHGSEIVIRTLKDENRDGEIPIRRSEVDLHHFTLHGRPKEMILACNNSGHGAPGIPKGSPRRQQREFSDLDDRRFVAGEQRSPLPLSAERSLRLVRRRSGGFKLLNGAVVSFCSRGGEHIGIDNCLPSLHVDDLTCSDVGGEKIRSRPDHVDSHNRSPRPTEDNDPVLVQMSLEELSDRDAVPRHALDCEVGRESIALVLECAASAGLIPLDDREIFLPGHE